MVRKRAIVFIDGNNWYHGVKTIIRKPRSVRLDKLSALVASKFDLDVVEMRYYNSIPDIELGEDNYYKHMVFLAGLKKQGFVVSTNKLKKLRVDGKTLRVEKGVDVMIATDMIRLSLIDNACDCCVLISGDSDFVPAMRTIKNGGKEVLTASVLRTYARELLQGEFRFWILKKGDVRKCFASYDGKK